MALDLHGLYSVFPQRSQFFIFIYKVVTSLFRLILLKMIAIYYILPFSILEKHPFFLLPFVGLLNLSVKQNQNCSLAQCSTPLNKPHSSMWVCRPQTAATVTWSSLSLGSVVVSSSTVLAPPFSSSTQFFYCSSHLPSQRLKSSSHKVLFFPFLSIFWGSYLHTVQRYMFHCEIPTLGLNLLVQTFCRRSLFSFLSELRYYMCEFMNIKYR